MWDLIVSVPDHCLSFYFWDLIVSVPDHCLSFYFWDLIVSVPDHCLSFYFTLLSTFYITTECYDGRQFKH